MNAEQRAAAIRMLVLDVDGVLSTGLLFYDQRGEQLKSFHSSDGLGIKLLFEQGIEVAIISGRSSPMVEQRARELGISHVIQDREDKLDALNSLAENVGIPLRHIAYLGDDLPDLGAIERAGLGMAVANADRYVARHADWVSQAQGGMGAVREACEFILHCQGKLQVIQESFRA